MSRRRAAKPVPAPRPTQPNNARPHLSLLSQEQIEQVHAYALRILAETGVRLDSPAVLAILEKHLGTKAVDDIIKLPSDVVEAAIRSAPKTIDIFDRRGEQVFTLGNDRLRFGVGVTALFYQDPLTDNLEVFARHHMRDMVRFGSSLPLYDVVSTVGIIQDVPPELGDLYGSLDMIANTTKPLVLLVSDEYKFPTILDMFEELHGSTLGERPFVHSVLQSRLTAGHQRGHGRQSEGCGRARAAVHLFQLQHGRGIDAHAPGGHAGPAAGRAAGRADSQPGHPSRRAYLAGHAARLLRHEDDDELL